MVSIHVPTLETKAPSQKRRKLWWRKARSEAKRCRPSRPYSEDRKRTTSTGPQSTVGTALHEASPLSRDCSTLAPTGTPGPEGPMPPRDTEAAEEPIRRRRRRWLPILALGVAALLYTAVWQLPALVSNRAHVGTLVLSRLEGGEWAELQEG